MVVQKVEGLCDAVYSPELPIDQAWLHPSHWSHLRALDSMSLHVSGLQGNRMEGLSHLLYSFQLEDHWEESKNTTHGM